MYNVMNRRQIDALTLRVERSQYSANVNAPNDVIQMMQFSVSYVLYIVISCDVCLCVCLCVCVLATTDRQR